MIKGILQYTLVLLSVSFLMACSHRHDNAYDDYFFEEEEEELAAEQNLKKNASRAGMMPEQIDSSGEKRFIFDPQRLAWGAYDESGELIRFGRASGGNKWCADVGRPCYTSVGEFKIYRKGSASCKSSKYPLPNGGAPIPHCMFFKGGMAIHGSNNVPDHNASHGCIRVLKEDAAWLHSDFLDIGTEVHVKPYYERS